MVDHVMARTHATSGAVLALAVAPALTHYGVPATGRSVAFMALAAAGGAMLPDFDHVHATIAHSLGPVTKAIAQLIASISGGHRQGTHSLAGIAAFTAFAWWMIELGGWPAGIWLGFLAAVGLAGLQVRFSKSSIVLHTILCLALGYWLISSSLSGLVPLDLTVWGVGIGATAHLLGDTFTRQGVPWLLPLSTTRFKLANLTTDHFTERVIVGPTLGITAAVQVLMLAGWWEPVRNALVEVWASIQATVA